MSGPGTIAHGWWRWDECLGDWRMVTPVPGSLSGFGMGVGGGENISEISSPLPGLYTGSLPSLGAWPVVGRVNPDVNLLF